MNEFSYLSEKILKSEFEYIPFKHILIEDFLSEEHFQKVINDPQIHWDVNKNTEELVNTLFQNGYEVQKFPGCITDPYEYIQRYNTNDFPKGRKGNPVESFGITFRLGKYDNPFIDRLVTYLNSSEFKLALINKFDIKFKTRIITAIQKNLSHYEISPHPDVREKALTYLLNINKDSSVDDENVHTHLLEFKDDWKFIPEYWRTNLSKNRCWIPWEWCNSKKVCSKNNSIVLFAPNIDTLHAIKMEYDHTKFQRTQLYGNLMGVGDIVPQMNWKELKDMKNVR